MNLGPDNLELSADWPGDINPYMDKTPLAENADKVMAETGAQLGQEVIRVAKSIRTAASSRPSLKASLDVLPFKL